MTARGENEQLVPPLRLDRLSVLMLLDIYGQFSGATAVFFGHNGQDYSKRDLRFETDEPLPRAEVLLRWEQAIERQARLKVVHIQTPAAEVALDLARQKYCLILDRTNSPTAPVDPKWVRPRFTGTPLTNVIECYRQLTGRSFRWHMPPQPSFTVTHLQFHPAPTNETAMMLELTLLIQNDLQIIHRTGQADLGVWIYLPQWAPCFPTLASRFDAAEHPGNPKDPWLYQGKTVLEWLSVFRRPPTQLASDRAHFALIKAGNRAEILVVKDLGRRVPGPLVSLRRRAPRIFQGWLPDLDGWQQYQRRCAWLLPFLTPLSNDSIGVLRNALRSDPEVAPAALEALRTIAWQDRQAFQKLTNQYPDLKVVLDPPPGPPPRHF